MMKAVGKAFQNWTGMLGQPEGPLIVFVRVPPKWSKGAA